MTDKKLAEEARREAPGFRPEVFCKNRGFSFGLTALFAIVYFGAALLTSAPLKTVAALDILGLPLGIWVGWLVLVAGLTLARIYLTHGGKK